MAKVLKMGKRPGRTGAVEAKISHGSVMRTGNVDSKSLPPKAVHGVKVLKSKSGRYILTSPVKSATTVTSWSNAFRKS